MGFLGDVASGLSIAGGPLSYWLNESMSKTAPTEPGRSDRSRTDVAYKGKNISARDFANSLFNDTNSKEYGNTFDQGYEALGQPLHAQNRDELYTAGTRALANSFADRVYAKTGFLPTEDQVRSFVGQNLNSGFAQKFITGIAPDQINGIADEYIAGNPDALENPGVAGQRKSAEEQRLSGITDQLNKIYDTGKANLVSGYNDTVYSPAKSTAVNDLAGQGMLSQPNSRYILDAIESNRSRDLTSGLNTLEGERAAGNIDVSKTIEDLLQRNRDRSLNASQFNRSFNASRDDTAFNQGIQRKSMDIAAQIGRLQANGQENDGLSGALGGAFSGGLQGGIAGGPWGALAGGVAGGALGYFGSKKKK